MPHVIAIDRDGVEHTIEATPGWSVMEIVREAGLPIEAACGGCCSCATCHVYVDPAWLARLTPPARDETMMLDEAFQVRDESRLSCQISFTAEMDGLKVTLAPEF
jgi:2Fe-2S ferredoxin